MEKMETLEPMEMQPEGTPLDSILERLDSYKKDFSLVTPETIAALRDEVAELKAVMDGDVLENSGDGGAGGEGPLMGTINREMRREYGA